MAWLVVPPAWGGAALLKDRKVVWFVPDTVLSATNWSRVTKRPP
jgi:hypothetical protein